MGRVESEIETELLHGFKAERITIKRASPYREVGLIARQ